MRRKTVGGNSGDTIVGQGTEIQGNLKATGLIRVDGKIEGTVETKGDFVVGSAGHVQAEITAQNVIVSGQVQGKITALGRLEIGKTGRLYADASVGSLAIEDGAVYQGQCKMLSKESTEDEFRDEIAVE